MKTVIVYDSIYKNTKKIADAIGSGVGHDARVLWVSEVQASDLKGVELLIVGSPTHGGRATPAIDEFLKSIPKGSLKDVHVAAFDTRFAPEDHGIGLRILMNIIRFAAERIAKNLTQKGGILVGKPEGFIVQDKEGPLKAGELQRATTWGINILHLTATFN